MPDPARRQHGWGGGARQCKEAAWVGRRSPAMVAAAAPFSTAAARAGIKLPSQIPKKEKKIPSSASQLSRPAWILRPAHHTGRRRRPSLAAAPFSASGGRSRRRSAPFFSPGSPLSSSSPVVHDAPPPAADTVVGPRLPWSAMAGGVLQLLVKCRCDAARAC